VSSIDELEGEFDFALVAVKSPLHHVALEPLVARGGIGAFVSMGNGLIQDRMEEIVGAGNLLACIVEWGGSNVGPGRLVRDSLGGYMVGELDGAVRERTRELAAALEPVGKTRVTDNVRGMIWSKLLINTTFTGLSAVSGLRYGGVASQGPDAVFALWAEGLAVGDAQGLTLESIHATDPHRFDETELARMMESMANVRPSMLQDLDAGRDTEVDVVNGGVAERGRELGIATPCNDAVVELVHSMERGERAPEPKWLRYVSEAQTTSATEI
jgi:2-dehydropantoate 2-reductase